MSSTLSPRTSLFECCPRSLLIYPIYPGMRSTPLVSPKTYSSSHESTVTMASRRATRLTLRAVTPAAFTEGSCRDVVIGFTVHGHYVSYYPFLSGLILYFHPCVPVHMSCIVIMYHHSPLRSILLLSSGFPIHVSYILDVLASYKESMPYFI